MEPEGSPRLLCPACNARYDAGQFCPTDGTPLVRDQSAAARKELVGQVLADRYRIVRLLGEGGMGQVFEAQHVNINKRFALKLLRPEIVSNPEAVQRFRQEAWSASSIGHENIIEIDDFASLPDGSVYLAMEFLEGRSLAERMREEPPLSLGEALDTFVQLAAGLEAAHEKGIIHRDMKPENVFLAQRGSRAVVKILDFGIAKVSGAESQSSLTRTGTIFGTPHYMSPEQALGKPLDRRTDIYSVGVIMYQVFTGQVPFEAESFMGILTKHITLEPRRPSEAAPDRRIPAEIEGVIMRAMAKESEARYPTMAALRDDLLAAIERYAPERLAGPATYATAEWGGTTRSGAIPAGGATPGSGLAGPVASRVTADELPVAARRSVAPFVVVGVLLVLGAGAGLVLLRRDPSPPVAAPTSAPTPAPVVTHPDTLTDVGVIVDTEPGGAKILRDGVHVGVTPEEVRVARGGVLKITLRRDGYIDEEVTVDPAKGHKLLVKLQRVRAARPAAPPAPAKPIAPPAPAKPIAPPPSPSVLRPVTQPVRRPDPYERVDEKPAKRPEILNPY